jgi:hypothetical protein
MKKVFVKFAFISGIALALSGCYPDGVETTSDTDLVYTNYDPEYNFDSVQTYYLGDSLRHIVDVGETADTKYDAYILGEIKSNLDALGWVEFDLNDTIIPGNKPDVVVVSALMILTTYDVYYYPYWGYGWYWKGTGNLNYYGYDWYYPWYGYGGSYVTSYSTGTVVILMFDPELIDNENERIKLNWAGILNGIAGYGVSDAQPRIKRGIEQAFKQSPYLNGN